LSGFSAVNIWGIARLQDAPDMLCCTPSGDYAAVECTAGHPDRADKLSNLYARTRILVRGLGPSGFAKFEAIT
jgi:hypothetical protein